MLKLHTLSTGRQAALGMGATAFMLANLAACTNQEIGTVAGAAAGAAAGKAIGGSGSNGTIGLVLGAVAGGYLGGQVAKWLTPKDKQQLSQTTNTALSTGAPGQVYSWANPDSGNKGQVTAQQVYKNQTGSVCRDFNSNVNSATGEQAQGTGTACKNADGTWTIVKAG